MRHGSGGQIARRHQSELREHKKRWNLGVDADGRQSGDRNLHLNLHGH